MEQNALLLKIDIFKALLPFFLWVALQRLNNLCRSTRHLKKSLSFVYKQTVMENA